VGELLEVAGCDDPVPVNVQDDVENRAEIAFTKVRRGLHDYLLASSLLIAIRRPDGIRQLQWATGWRA